MESTGWGDSSKNPWVQQRWTDAVMATDMALIHLKKKIKEEAGLEVGLQRHLQMYNNYKPSQKGLETSL